MKVSTDWLKNNDSTGRNHKPQPCLKTVAHFLAELMALQPGPLGDNVRFLLYDCSNMWWESFLLLKWTHVVLCEWQVYIELEFLSIEFAIAVFIPDLDLNLSVLHVCLSVHIAHVEVRGQLAGVTSLPPCGSWGSSSGAQAWCQTPLPLNHLLGPRNFYIPES